MLYTVQCDSFEFPYIFAISHVFHCAPTPRILNSLHRYVLTTFTTHQIKYRYEALENHFGDLIRDRRDEGENRVDKEEEKGWNWKGRKGKNGEGKIGMDGEGGHSASGLLLAFYILGLSDYS